MHGKEKDWLRALPAYQQACHLVRDSGEFKFDASGTPYNVKEQQAEEEQHGQSALAGSSPRAHPPLQTRLLGATLWARGERPHRVDATERLLHGLRSGACPRVTHSHTAYTPPLCLPKVAHTTPPLIMQEEELFGLSFEEVLAQEKGAGLDLRGSGGMAGSLR